MEDKEVDKEKDNDEKPILKEKIEDKSKLNFWQKLGSAVQKAVDCCLE